MAVFLPSPIPLVLFPFSLFIYHIIMVYSKSQRYVLWFYRTGVNESKRKKWDPNQKAQFWSALLSRSAKSSCKPYMWNHFSPVRTEFTVWLNPLRNKGIFIASPHRFVAPGVRCLSGRDELQIKPCPKICLKRKEIHRKILARSSLQGCQNSHRCFVKVCFSSVRIV